MANVTGFIWGLYIHPKGGCLGFCESSTTTFTLSRQSPAILQETIHMSNLIALSGSVGIPPGAPPWMGCWLVTSESVQVQDSVVGIPYPKKIGSAVIPGGGFKYCLFSPLFGGDFKFDLYFSGGLEPPTSHPWW